VVRLLQLNTALAVGINDSPYSGFSQIIYKWQLCFVSFIWLKPVAISLWQFIQLRDSQSLHFQENTKHERSYSKEEKNYINVT
jgi:hypothetical protein